MAYMHLNIIQLPQGSTLSRLHGVGTTSQKGELEVAFLEFFVPFRGLCAWWAFKAMLTLKETLTKLTASGCYNSLSTAWFRAAAACIGKALTSDSHQSC